MLSQEAFFTPPHNKLDLLKRVSGSWAALQQVIEGLSEGQLTQIRDPAGWSIQDHLVHLSVWEEALIALVKGLPLFEVFGLDRRHYEQIETTDQLNAIVHQRVRDYPLPEVLRRCQQSHQQILALLSDLPEMDWKKPLSFFQPEEDDPRPILTKIVGDTYRHYAEHRSWIESLIQNDTSNETVHEMES
jgi:hypothetical protein